MAERQLGLFARPRQRGVTAKVRAPTELKLHMQLAHIIRLTIRPGWLWTHIPLGEYRDPATAGKLKAMGVNGGLPDFMFVSSNLRHMSFLELKRKGGRLSDLQREWAYALVDAGAHYVWTHDLDEALRFLREEMIIRDVRVSA